MKPTSRWTRTAAGIVAGSCLLGGCSTQDTSRPHATSSQPPSPHLSAPTGAGASPASAGDTPVSRPFVYAEGTTVHIDDKSIEAKKPVAFIDPTDDGAVYEASLDGTLWFTDGTTTSVIGKAPMAAAPTFHGEAVATGDYGSLVVWPDVSHVKEQLPDELLVYDTSRHEEVGRIPVIGDYNMLLYVDRDSVYFNPDPDLPGCWVIEIQDIHHCPEPHLFRFDVASGKSTKISVAQLEAEVRSHSRLFWRRPSASNDLPFSVGTLFRQVDRRLVAGTFDGDPTLTLTDGEEVGLRLPAGYSVPGLKWGGSVIYTSQWLDDDHVVVWATEGGGDLPPQHGDLLVCRLPDGICRVEVPRTSDLYVAPYRY
jgi:hypothetical protein